MVRKYRRKLGYNWRRLRKAPFLSEVHKMNRLLWCLNYRECDFEKYIFVETKVIVNDAPHYHTRLPSSQPKALKITNKYRQKVNVYLFFIIK